MDAFFARYFPHDSDAVEGYHAALRDRLRDAARVLDLGCGDNTQFDHYRTPSREVWGVDVQWHPRLTSPEWFRLMEPAGRVPFPDATFDLITSCWVLEHVEKPEIFLAEVRRLLRPGGSFISLTINGCHYVTWLSRLVGLLPHAGTQWLVRRLYGRESYDTYPTYYRLNTTGQFRRMARLAGLGYGVVRRFANPDYFRFSPLIRRAAIVCDWLLEKAAGGLGRVYVVVVFHKPGQGGIVRYTSPVLPPSALPAA
jgi:SAM-dependent methyltransferase